MTNWNIGTVLFVFIFLFGALVSESERIIFALEGNEPAPPIVPIGLLVIAILITIFNFFRGED